MPKKQLNIVIILAIVVVAIFIALGFMGFNSFAPQPEGGADTAGAAQALLAEVQAKGSVADLRAEDIAVGEGDPIGPGDTLSVEYTGILPNGTVFDSTAAHGGTPLTLVVASDGSLRTPEGGGLILGWSLGMAGMKEGGSRLLAIPPSLGYGANSVGSIPPNSTLIFQVNLLKRVPAGSTDSEAAPAE